MVNTSVEDSVETDPVADTPVETASSIEDSVETTPVVNTSVEDSVETDPVVDTPVETDSSVEDSVVDTPIETASSVEDSVETDLLSVAQLKEIVANMIGMTLFAPMQNCFDGIQSLTREDILTIQEYACYISEDIYVHSQFATLSLLSEYLFNRANLLSSIFGDDDITFFPSEAGLGLVVDTLKSNSNPDEDDDTETPEKTTTSENRNIWFQEWLSENGFTYSNFTETELPRSRQCPFVMYHVTNEYGQNFIALICDEVGNSNCFINLKNMTLEQACRLALQTKRNVYRDPNVIFKTNNPSGEDAFKTRLNALKNLDTFFKFDRFFDSINTHKNLASYVIKTETFDLHDVTDFVDFDNKSINFENLPDGAMRNLFENLYKWHKQCPELYRFEMLVHQLNKCLSITNQEELVWNRIFKDYFIDILSLKDLYPQFDRDVRISQEELLEFYEDLDLAYRKKSNNITDKLKLALGTLYYRAMSAGDEQRAIYYFLKYKSLTALVTPEFVNGKKRPAIGSAELLEFLFDPTNFETSRFEPNSLIEITSLNPQYDELPLNVITDVLDEYVCMLNNLNKDQSIRFKNLFFVILIELIQDLLTKVKSDDFDANQSAFESQNTKLEEWEIMDRYIQTESVPEQEVITYEPFMRDLSKGIQAMFYTQTGRIHKTQIPSRCDMTPLISATACNVSFGADVNHEITFKPLSLATSIVGALQELGYDDTLQYMNAVSSPSNVGIHGYLSVADGKVESVTKFVKTALFGKLTEATK